VSRTCSAQSRRKASKLVCRSSCVVTVGATAVAGEDQLLSCRRSQRQLDRTPYSTDRSSYCHLCLQQRKRKVRRRRSRVKEEKLRNREGVVGAKV